MRYLAAASLWPIEKKKNGRNYFVCVCVLRLVVAVAVGDGRIHQSPPSTQHFHKKKEEEETKWPQKETLKRSCQRSLKEKKNQKRIPKNPEESSKIPKKFHRIWTEKCRHRSPPHHHPDRIKNTQNGIEMS